MTNIQKELIFAQKNLQKKLEKFVGRIIACFSFSRINQRTSKSVISQDLNTLTFKCLRLSEITFSEDFDDY